MTTTTSQILALNIGRDQALYDEDWATAATIERQLAALWPARATVFLAAAQTHQQLTATDQ